MEFFQEIIANTDPVINWIVVATLWLVSCIIAINLSLGGDAQFILKQMQYTFIPLLGQRAGEILGTVVFMVGWLLWPIAIVVGYFGLSALLMEKTDWLEIVLRLAKFIAMVLLYVLGGFIIWVAYTAA